MILFVNDLSQIALHLLRLYFAITIVITIASQIPELRRANYGNFLIIKLIPTIFAVHISPIMATRSNLAVTVTDKRKHFVFLAVNISLQGNGYSSIVFVNLIPFAAVAFQIYHNNII